MLKTFGTVSARRVLGAILLSGATALVAVGCGGGDSGSDSSAGAGGDAGDTGEAGSSAAGKGAAPNGGSGGDAGSIGEGGAAGTIETPAQNHSAISFVNSGAVSTSKNFVLISGLGESVGGTVGSKRSRSLEYTFVPGVIAASTP